MSKKKYILTTVEIVEAEQVDLRQDPWPDNVHPWPEEWGKSEEMPPAYYGTFEDHQWVCTGDYIVTDSHGKTKIIREEDFERGDYNAMHTSIQEIIEHALTLEEVQYKQWYLWKLAEVMGIALRFDAGQVDKGIAPQDVLAAILQQSTSEKINA